MPHQEKPVGREPEDQGAGETLRRLAAVLVALEALALLAGAVALGIEALGADSAAGGVGLALVVAAVGLALAGSARGLLHGARWTRGPVLTWQLLQAGVGMPVTVSAYWYFGVPILALAVVVGLLVASRQVIPHEGDRAAV